MTKVKVEKGNAVRVGRLSLSTRREEVDISNRSDEEQRLILSAKGVTEIKPGAPAAKKEG